MGCKIFLDINIIADFCDPDRLGYDSAVALFTKMYEGYAESYVSESVINTASYILRKTVPISSFIELVSGILSSATVLPCSNDTIISAYHNAKNDLEDAVLYQIALENKMDYFVTSDVKDYKKIEHPLLPVVTAKQVLKIINH